MIEKDSNQLMAHLIPKMRSEGKLVTALFELTYRCQYCCIHCYVSQDEKQEVNTSDAFKILDQLRQKGCLQVAFSGGEPFLREDLFDILEYAKSIGLLFVIFTNGALIDTKTAERLNELKPNLLKISMTLYGPDEETYEKITGVKGQFEKAVGAIRLLQGHLIPLTVKLTLLSENMSSYAALEKLCLSIEDGKTEVRTVMSPLAARTDGDCSPLEHSLSSTDLEQILSPKKTSDKDCRMPEKEGCGEAFQLRDFNCLSGITEVTVNPYGCLKPCVFVKEPAFDILSKGLEDALSKLKQYLAGLADTPFICRDCDMAPFCRPCIIKIMGYGDNYLLECHKPTKQYGEMYKKMR